ncbi:3-oxoacyl-ACP reductase FabG [Sutcliffiella rhizosphaerae]|uniref:3-oxoacyl-[acyl-carrier-protein] reductase FabG n=1 Tax=Sutcliffiella rhizosphaerae TaxID=2880967 RepID=A0ABM8YTV4_9BACI|nr:3-oxoacyl-ACP reductase FabG [Sutcliffiella rhizosphaerae]CAG9623401.1 3-oxoacyl-[acyl-carrier-protein] reductase FabG [Sutcliffiella rhizosphaerae]
MNYSYNFQGKVAVVIGGSRGIGAQIVKDLCKAGCKVFFTYSSSKTEARLLSNEINKKEDHIVKALKLDLLNKDDLISFQTEMEKIPKVDYLINNAGIVRDAPMYKLQLHDWEEVITVNLTGAYKIIKPFIRRLAHTKGSIVNVSSISGLMGNPGQTNYSASKAGLIGLTKSLSKEIAPLGVRVNCVAPGYIETELTSRTINDKEKIKVKKLIPIKRYGKSYEVSSCVLFLLSEASTYITGQTIILDGGLT